MTHGNTSGLAPLGRAVLVRPYSEPKAEKSVIFIPESIERGMMALDTQVEVVEVGPACWPDEPPRCSAGDVVFIARLSGWAVHSAPGDGQPYRFVNDRDVFAKVIVRNES